VGEQAGGLGNAERDQSRVGGRGLVWPDRRWRLGAGPAAQQGGGDGADGQGGHDQHGVPGDRGVEPDLGLVQSEAALSAGQRSPAARTGRDGDAGWPPGRKQ
jgi:hypothetical protein